MILFNALGALDLRDSEGREILSVLAQPKRLALLAYLAASPAGRFHRRDTLLGLFWPESDQQHARDSLRQAVRHLRRSLGEGVIVGRGDDELGINGMLLWCDAAAFEQALDAGDAERALDLYRGELLPGLFLSEVPEFERWLDRERARLLPRAVEAAWTLAEQREAAGDRTGAVRCARRAAELCPNDEATLRRLITLLAGLGHRAGAVRVYDEFAARLAQEWGVEPSPETRALAKEVRTSEVVGVELARPADAQTRPFSAELRVHASTPEPPGIPRDGSGEATPGDRRIRRDRRLAKLALATGLLLFAAVGVGGLASGTLWSRSDAERVLIVPFENRTGDPSLDPLGRWAADWVTQGLARTNHVQVIDATVSMSGSSAREQRGDHLRALLKRTGAGTVVSGAYYQHSDSIQFQVQITDADGGAVIPAIAVSGSLRQPQAPVHTLGERITGALAAHFDPWNRALNSDGTQPPSYEAYQAWVEGLERYSRRDYREAQERLLYAASLDSSFVAPLIWAAATHHALGEIAQADSLIRIGNARRDRLPPFDRHFLDLWQAQLLSDRVAEYRAARRMLEVAPASELALYLVGKNAVRINLPGEAVEVLRRIDVERSAVDWDAHGTALTHALHLLGDYAGELEEAQRVRTRRPELLRPMVEEARALAALGRVEEVLQLLDRALALPPQSQETPAGVARIAAEELRTHGHADAAEQALARALAWYRTLPAAERATATHRYDLARVLYRAGRWEEAERIFRELSERAPDNPDYLGFLGAVAVRRGDASEADRISEGLARMEGPYLRGSNTLWRARIGALAGRNDEAITLLRASFAQGQGYGLAIHSEPDFHSLRDSPAFRRLLQPRS